MTRSIFCRAFVWLTPAGRHFFVAVFLAAGAVPAFSAADVPFPGAAAGDSIRISLRDALFTALERNPTVSIERLSPEIAGADAREERSVFEPELSLSAGKSDTKTRKFLGTKPDPVQLKTESTTYTAGVSGFLPTGTTIAATGSLTGTESSLYDPQANGVLELTVTQSLLQGFGLGANMASLRKANLDVDISRAGLKAVAGETAAQVEQAYWDLYLAREEIAIQETSLELADRLLAESEERVNVGKLPELELAAVRAEAANRRETLIDARGSYEQARLDFLYLLNLPGTASWSSVPVLTDVPLLPADSLDSVENHEKLGMKYRPDLAQARLDLEKGDIDVIQTRNGLLPKLDLFVTLGRTTYATAIEKVKTDLNSPYRELSGGLTFSMPVSQGDARARHVRAKRSREQMELAVRNMERTVERDVRSAYVEVVRARQQINATRITRELQERKLDAELEKFRVGKSTNYLVLQAQRDFTASRQDEARSMVTYLGALTNLYQMEGTFLERRGIDAR